MKNLLILMPFLMVFLNCASQNYLDPATTERLVKEEAFTFMAQRANPTNYDVISIANSIPNYGSARMMNLDEGYTLTLRSNELTANLPYFGRAYRSSVSDSDNQGLRFTSKNYTVQKSTTQKGNHLLRIKPNDVSHIRLINIEIYRNGKAFVSVDANDRQPISYDGYIMKNEEPKK